MPYKSDAQRKFFNAAAARGEMPQKTVNEFNKASKGMDLPARVKKSAGGMIRNPEGYITKWASRGEAGADRPGLHRKLWGGGYAEGGRYHHEDELAEHEEPNMDFDDFPEEDEDGYAFGGPVHSEVRNESEDFDVMAQDPRQHDFYGPDKESHALQVDQRSEFDEEPSADDNSNPYQPRKKQVVHLAMGGSPFIMAIKGRHRG